MISPGTANTSRPSSSAKSAVMRAPDRSRASTTTVASESPAMIRLRAGNRHGAGSTPGGYSETTCRPTRRSAGPAPRGGAGSPGRCRSRAPPASPAGFQGAPVSLAVDRLARARSRRRARPTRARGRASARPGRRTRSTSARRRRRRRAPTAGRRPADEEAPADRAAARAAADSRRRLAMLRTVHATSRAPSESGRRAPRRRAPRDASASGERGDRRQRPGHTCTAARREARESTARASSSAPRLRQARRITRSRVGRASTRAATAAEASPAGPQPRATARAEPGRRDRSGRGAPARACPDTPRAAAASRSTRRPDRPAHRRGKGSSSRRAGTEPGRPRVPARARLRRPVLERLPQRLERRPRELGELVQEEDAAMREPRLAGTRPGASADDRRRRGGVVRRAERRPVDERPARGQEPATEWMRVTSSACSRVSAGRMPGSRRASMVFPVPGGPASRRLCRPAAASSSARRARSWPRTSARSGRGRRRRARHRDRARLERPRR